MAFLDEMKGSSGSEADAFAFRARNSRIKEDVTACLSSLRAKSTRHLDIARLDWEICGAGFAFATLTIVGG